MCSDRIIASGCPDKKDPANFSGHFHTCFSRSIAGKMKSGKSIPILGSVFGRFLVSHFQ
jgi:hypothetical protein